MSEPLRVLLVEDSDTDAKLIAQALRGIGRELRIERVEDGDAMRAALSAGTFDIVISDWSLPRFSGRAAFTVLGETGLDLPFILVSGTVGEETAVDAMRAGANDYVLKDRLSRLAPAVERELREHEARVSAEAVHARHADPQGPIGTGRAAEAGGGVAGELRAPRRPPFHRDARTRCSDP